MIEEEEWLERAGRTILPGACPDTLPHLVEFDGDYIMDYSENVVERRPNDTRPHQVINYSKSQKLVEEAMDENPYDEPKDLGIDYRFWNEFYSNFYASVIFNSRKSKIVKMQYIDWQEMESKHEPEFDKAIKACESFWLSNLMTFRDN